jgi:hypothetical protein
MCEKLILFGLVCSFIRIHSEVQITEKVCTSCAYYFIGESYLELDGYISP